MIICITGYLLAGKGTVSQYLRSKGFSHMMYSDILREEASRRGIEITRDNLVNLGNELREKHGPAVLSKMIVEKIKKNNLKNVVVDGPRNPAEILEIKNSIGCVVVSVEAPRKIRFERMVARNRENDPRTFEGFIEVDMRDLGHGQEATGNHVQKCIDMAEHRIDNSGTLDDLYKKIDGLLIKLQ